MVGLMPFGEAAWSGEQIFNTQLAEQRPAEPPLIEFTQWMLAHLSSWIDDIAAHRDGARNEGEVKIAADRLTRRLQAGVGGSSDITLPLGLPGASDLELRTLAQEPEAAAGDLAFELDLSRFDAPAARASEPAAAVAPTVPAAPDAASVMFARFDGTADDVATAPAELDATFVDSLVSGPVDLDLGVPTEPAPLIQNLAPSGPRLGPPEAEPGLLLDLATGSSVRAGAAADPGLDSGSGVDFELESAPDAASEPAVAVDEHVKVVGPLRIGIPLFNIYLNEADELSRRLMTEVAEWAMELHRPVGEAAISLAHSLAGSSATVGFADLSHLARALEHALARSEVIGHGTAEEARLFVDATEEIRRLLHQFAAGFLRESEPQLLARLAEHEVSSAIRLEAVTAASELAAQDEEAPAQAAIAFEPLLTLDTDVDAGSQARSEAVAERTATPLPLVPVVPPVAVAADPALDHAPDAPVQEPSGGPDEHLTAAAVPGEAPASDPAAAVAPVEARIQEGAPRRVEPDDQGAAVRVDTAAMAQADPNAGPAEPMADAAEEPAESQFGALSPFPSLGLSELKPLASAPQEALRPAAGRASTFGDLDDEIDAVDAVDLELFPIFEEEAQELLPKLDGQLREWAAEPANLGHASACMRTLHTLKGGARLAGAMRLGEMAHRLETRIERLTATDAPSPGAGDVETLQTLSDSMTQAFEALRSRDAQAYADAVAAAVLPAAQVPAPDAAPVPAVAPVFEVAPMGPAAVAANDSYESARAAERGAAKEARAHTRVEADANATAELPEIDWSRFTQRTSAPVKAVEKTQATQSAVRVRAPLLDRLVNQAGEVSITRSRIESGVGQIKGSLSDLTDNLERLRGQLRDIELQGEVQMTSRLEAAKAASQSFDPLEFDRFTRFQELTRMMAESVNDVATVQRTLQRSLESTEDELAAQARLTRDLQDDLLRTRMIEFEGLSDRLYRVVRLAAKETGKQVRLDIVGGSIEVDRGVLDRMTGAFEHLLRNCVSHGIELPAARLAAGKDAAGSIVVALSHEGNEVGVEFRDDGAGLDLPRIRAKAIAQRLIDPDAPHDDAELANLIFTPGFTTAESVTELAGRGVGMDVVRSEVVAMGGRIETATAAGQGTSFKLILPLTTAVTQVVMLRCGDSTVAVPSTLVEIVRRAKAEEIAAAYESGSFDLGDATAPFFWLGALLQLGSVPGENAARMRTVVVVRSAQQRIVVHVDEVLGNQEVVVKNLGPQLSRLPGLAGMTLLASGAVTLIYNPVALATLYGETARQASQGAMRGGQAGAPAWPHAAEAPVQVAPLVLVVDDSLTVRRVTQRMLVREGYRVKLAKDGLDALERLAEEVPSIVLSDIEMPRMDGFDLVRNIRSDARWRSLPVIMITSRIAQKHREHAAELGVDHYLGKPYSEEDLLALVGRYTVAASATA
ncbi:MAG TPA: response regulator [Caldimonas sp.]|nr:response regulator [Caldimonas sp.]